MESRKLFAGNDLRLTKKLSKLLSMNLDDIQNRLESAIAELIRLRDEVEASKPKPPAKALRMAEREICLDCQQPYNSKPGKITRGVHNACLQRINRDIKAGLFTETQAIEEGLLLPKKPGGRKRVLGSRAREIFDEASVIASDPSQNASERAELDPLIDDSIEIAQQAAAEHKAKKTAKKAAGKRSQRKKSG